MPDKPTLAEIRERMQTPSKVLAQLHYERDVGMLLEMVKPLDRLRGHGGVEELVHNARSQREWWQNAADDTDDEDCRADALEAAAAYGLLARLLGEGG